ncbi:hypothetical protein KSP40_PGU009510 [Platanthera guangdongensis]|uniref:Uncharacterized protein n=1 Tax=Platanthera guangdongensis TaxID=2320717 RepID=A0ABR2LQF5_9ASPA
MEVLQDITQAAKGTVNEAQDLLMNVIDQHNQDKVHENVITMEENFEIQGDPSIGNEKVIPPIQMQQEFICCIHADQHQEDCLFREGTFQKFVVHHHHHNFLQRFDVYESDKKYIMHLLGESFKDNKAKFKSSFYRPSDTPEAVIARGRPKSMPVCEFVDMVTYWHSPKGKLAKMMNTISRSNQNTESNPEDTPPTEPNTRVHP